MRGGTKIVGLFDDQPGARPIEEQAVEYHEAEAPGAVAPSRTLALLMALAALLWLGFAVAAAVIGYGGRAPALPELAGLLATMAAPLALIGVLYLLFATTGRRRRRHFSTEAAGISAEADLINERMALLADRAREIGSVVEAAASRLDTALARLRDEGPVAERLSAQVQATVAATADRLDHVVRRLPDAERGTRGLTATLEEAMMSAMDGVAALDQRLSAAGEQAGAVETRAAGSATALAEQLRALEVAGETAARRVAGEAEAVAKVADDMLARSIGAADQARRGLDEQAAAMGALADRSRGTMIEAAENGTAALAARLAALSAEVDAIGAGLARHDQAGGTLIGRLRNGLVEVETRIAALDAEGLPATERLAGAIAGLSDQADRLTGTLAGGSSLAEALLMRADTLLAALDANAREIDETLPAALRRLDTAADASRARLEAIGPAFDGMASRGDRMLGDLARAEALLDGQQARLEALAGFAADADREASALVGGSGARLIEMMVRVREAADQAALRARETMAALVPGFAAALADAGENALAPLVGGRVEAQLAAIGAAAERAAALSDGAAERLSARAAEAQAAVSAFDDRLADLDGAGGRQQFADRVSRILDALHTSAIDLAGLMSGELRDDQWRAFLGNDHGAFVRHALQLLGDADTDALRNRYAQDGGFRETVNRFIADFEAMLRAAVGQREGAALGITLLSSDVGRLYAALAPLPQTH